MLLNVFTFIMRLVVGAVLAFIVLLLAMVVGFFGGSGSGGGNGLFGMVTWVMICAVIWAFTPIIRALVARSDAASKVSPTYQWRCYVCQASNPPGHENCEKCGSPASASAAEIAAAKKKLSESTHAQPGT